MGENDGQNNSQYGNRNPLSVLLTHISTYSHLYSAEYRKGEYISRAVRLSAIKP